MGQAQPLGWSQYQYLTYVVQIKSFSPPAAPRTPHPAVRQRRGGAHTCQHVVLVQRTAHYTLRLSRSLPRHHPSPYPNFPERHLRVPYLPNSAPHRSPPQLTSPTSARPSPQPLAYLATSRCHSPPPHRCDQLGLQALAVTALATSATLA